MAIGKPSSPHSVSIDSDFTEEPGDSNEARMKESVRLDQKTAAQLRRGGVSDTLHALRTLLDALRLERSTACGSGHLVPDT